MFARLVRDILQFLLGDQYSVGTGKVRLDHHSSWHLKHAFKRIGVYVYARKER